MTENQQAEAAARTEWEWRPGFGWVERTVTEAEVIDLRPEVEQDERKRA